DGGAIVTALQQQNVPYRFSNGGSAILVPESVVHDIRLRLAAEGLPRGGMVGFELLEGQKLGVSQFHEQINFQRALEGELSRTIQSVATVAKARVHLAIPKQTAFLRNPQKPTASVMVNLLPGRSLNDAQVAGIVHLVAASVPQLETDQVSVVDQNGQLLTRSPDRNPGLDPTQLQYVDQLERQYIERIETILTPIVGAGNFRAQVMADIDFNQSEQTAESFKPNPSPEQAIRSQQNNEALTGEFGPQGVPGALTNQPPVPATAPITAPAAGAGGAATDTIKNSNRSSVINYELDKTIQHVRRAVGQVRRLSVAVVLNHRTTTAANGRTDTAPLSEEEVRKITDLIREAVGYTEARGDTLNVANSMFTAAATEELPEVPLWKDPEIIAIAKEALRYLILLGVLAFVAFGVIRPLMRQIMPPPAAEEEEEAAADEGEEGEEEGEEGAEVSLSPEAAAAQSYEEKLARARQLAKDNPKMVANLVKEWLGAGAHEQR
ncbi:MAG: flagellar M-ring protein FliF, partial [Rhodocyclaceae bacterium]|nr:flagellar M-ring protein FliF [Rhodocyclaceae bacterium]